MVVAVAWFSGLWMPDQVRHDGVWCRAGSRAGIHYPLVIPAPEPVSMVLAVAWFSGLWMPECGVIPAPEPVSMVVVVT
jgi:hypothetical protein